MKAVILAAGTGSRLYPLTENIPKCLLPIGEKTILAHIIDNMLSNKIDEIIIVGGFKFDRVKHYLKSNYSLGKKIKIIENSKYDKTNNIYSLWLSKPHINNNPFILIDADVVCDMRIIREMCNSSHSILVVDSKQVLGEEEMKVVLDEKGKISRLAKEINPIEAYGESIGISKFTVQDGNKLFNEIDKLIDLGDVNSFYEKAIQNVLNDIHLEVYDVGDFKWIEIDFFTDYQEAIRIFSDNKQENNIMEDIDNKIKDQVLFIPGPVSVSKEVKLSLLHNDICHREDEFVEMYKRIIKKTNTLFGVDVKDDYTSIIITGSGTLANESVISSIFSGKKVLFLSNGEFGHRLYEMGRIWCGEAILMDFGIGNKFSIDKLNNILMNQDDIYCVVMVHHETSTGMLNPVDAIGQIIKCYKGKIFFVDMVSSLATQLINLKKWNIDVATSSVNKAIGSLPGLSIVCSKIDLLEKLKDSKIKSKYLNLYDYYIYLKEKGQTPNTPAVSLFFAYEKALDNILMNGLQKHIDIFNKLSGYIRERLKQIGLSFYIDEVDMSNVVTTVNMPSYISFMEFHDYLKENGYIIYGGKGPLDGKVFQIANMGKINKKQIEGLIKTIALAIKNI